MHSKISTQEKLIGQLVKENQSIGTLVLQSRIQELQEKAQTQQKTLDNHERLLVEALHPDQIQPRSQQMMQDHPANDGELQDGRQDGSGPAQMKESNDKKNSSESVIPEKKVTFVLPGEEDVADKKKAVKFGD